MKRGKQTKGARESREAKDFYITMLIGELKSMKSDKRKILINQARILKI
ncbi:MAG: hypothetical protein FWD71_23855 [Oscillospiraceae bacterium]|nr:hypothetical protein [Oscillospiraceae bacterium]